MSFKSGCFSKGCVCAGPQVSLCAAYMVPHFARAPLITKARCLGALSSHVSSAAGFESPPVVGHCVGCGAAGETVSALLGLQ